MDVEVGANGAPLFDVAGCASFVVDTGDGRQTKPTGRCPTLRRNLIEAIPKPGCDKLLQRDLRPVTMSPEPPKPVR